MPSPRKRLASSQSRQQSPQTVASERPVGLINLGNSCYFNAVVQALNHCEPFAASLRTLAGALEAGGDDSARLTLAFVNCLASLYSSPTVVRPAQLLGAVQAHTPTFAGNRQQDAHELLRSLLDGVHQHLQRHPQLLPAPTSAAAPAPPKSSVTDTMVIDDCVVLDEVDDGLRLHPDGFAPAPPPPASPRSASPQPTGSTEPPAAARASPRPHLAADSSVAPGADAPSRPGTAAPLPDREPATSAVQRLFEGSLVSTVRCLRCGRTSHVLEPCMDLSLPLPSAAGGSLHACLASFFAVEELRGAEQYACERCRAKQDCSKSLRLLHLPPLLVVHLLRFRGGGGGGGGGGVPAKASEHVAFPLEGLDLGAHLCAHEGEGEGEATYDLCALIQHHGATAASGHYTAMVRRGAPAAEPSAEPGAEPGAAGAAGGAQWFHIDDGRAEPVEAAAVARAQAYLLFYARRAAGGDNGGDNGGGGGGGEAGRERRAHVAAARATAAPAASDDASPREAALAAAWADADAADAGAVPRPRGRQQWRARLRPAAPPRVFAPPDAASAPAARREAAGRALAPMDGGARARLRLRFASARHQPSPPRAAGAADDTTCLLAEAHASPQPLDSRPASADAHTGPAAALQPAPASPAAARHSRGARWRPGRRGGSASPTARRRLAKTREARDAWRVYQTPRRGLRRPWNKHTRIHTWPLAEAAPSPSKLRCAKTLHFGLERDEARRWPWRERDASCEEERP